MNLSAVNNYNDFSGLSELKLQADIDPKEASKAVAQQFESLFITMMMKSMRDTLDQDSLFSSDQMQTYQKMYDQQLAVDMSNRGGIGLAEIIERQLTKSMGFTQNID